MKELAAILKARADYPAEAMALATLVKAVGSSYRRAGAHMLIRANGETVGSVSGGCLEQDVIAHGQKIAADGNTILLSYDTTAEEDVTFGVGLGCKGVIEILVEPLHNAAGYLDRIEKIFRSDGNGVVATVFRINGNVSERIGDRIEFDESHFHETRFASKILERAEGSIEVFFEVINAPASLFIFGAGYDAIPLTRLAKELGFRVTVADRRPAYATRERFPDADAVHVAEPKWISKFGVDEHSAGVVMNHHYISDRDCLRELLPRPMRYVGLMGPRRRAEQMLEEFRAEGLLVGEAMLQKLHNPVGLDIGAEGPEQIALAILAEINAVFAGHGGGKLREKKGPIHSPRSELP